MLSDATQVAIRYHLGYSNKGLPVYAPSGSLGSTAMGSRFNPEYLNLEYRISTLQPAEESFLTGLAYAAVAYNGNDPNPGDTITVTLSGGGLGSPVPITATAQIGDDKLKLLNRLVAAINQNNTLVNAGFQATNPWGQGVFAANKIPLPQIQVTAPAAFTAAVVSTGMIGASVPQAGGLPDCNIPVSSNPPTKVYGLIPILNYLDGAVGGSTRNMDMQKADTFVARHDEMEQRDELYNKYRKRLARFLGVPINKSGGAGGGPRRVVV